MRTHGDQTEVCEAVLGCFEGFVVHFGIVRVVEFGLWWFKLFWWGSEVIF